MAREQNLVKLVTEMRDEMRQCKAALIRNTAQADITANSLREEAILRHKYVELIREHDPSFALELEPPEPLYRDIVRVLWTADEDRELVQRYADGEHPDDIADEMGRSRHSVCGRHTRIKNRRIKNG